MGRRLLRFLRRPPADQVLALEALVALAIARIVILGVPFGYTARWLGRAGAESPLEPVCDQRLLERIHWSLAVVSRHAWWNCRCFTRALAARMMLKRRALATTFYFGTSRPDPDHFSAHVWLRCGNVIVTGAEELSGFTRVASFSDYSVNGCTNSRVRSSAAS